MFFVTFSLISGPRRPLKLKEKDTKNNITLWILRRPSRWLAHPSHRYICFPNFARSCHSLTRLLNELPRERQTRRTNVLYVKQSVLNKSCQSDSDPQMPSLPCAHLVHLHNFCSRPVSKNPGFGKRTSQDRQKSTFAKQLHKLDWQHCADSR